MRSVRALLRGAWLDAVSYRWQAVWSFLSMWLTVVPLYFVAKALQSTMARSIANEGQQYFPFLLLGLMGIGVATTAVQAVPAAVQGGISSGMFEALLMTRARRTALVAGMTAYPILASLVRGALMLVVGLLFGVRVHPSGILPSLGIFCLIIVSYWAIGLIAAAMVVAFRTSGPMVQGVVVVTTILGGAYYPVNVIPIAWLKSFTSLVPAAPGLRAVRRILLDGVPVGTVLRDVVMLTVLTAALLLVGVIVFRAALRHAGRRGTLSHF